MLLNVIGCGQVVFNASAAVDYSQHWKTLDSYDEKYFYNDDALISEVESKVSQLAPNVDFPYYFICISSESSLYSSFIQNGGSLRLNVTFYFFKTCDIINDNSVAFSIGKFDTDVLHIDSHYTIDSSYQVISNLSIDLARYTEIVNFNYYRNTSYCVSYHGGYHTPSVSDYFDNRFVYLYQNTNIPDFPFPDFVNHGGGGSSDQLKVDVHFKPTLSGNVDRLITDSNGDTSLANRMRFTLTNNSKFPIQYELFIVKKSADFDVTAPYNDSYVFMYYSNSWVYAPCIDDMTSWNNQLPQKQNKSSPWHYVKSGETVGSFFNYSQINLVESQDYTVYVTATRCDYDLASECVVSPVEEIYSDMKQVHRAEVVFQSDFSMVHYSDVKYDPNDNSNGVIPFSSYEDIQKNHFSYNAKEDPDGKIDYNAKDVYSDKNSWWNNPSSGLGSSGSSGSSSSSASSNFNSLSRSFSNFFSFVNTTFNYFPSSFKLTISLGLTSIVVLGLIKAVFK